MWVDSKSKYRHNTELRVCEVVDIFDSFSGCDLRKPSVVYGLYS